MPIRPENKERYPVNWPEIRAKVLKRAGQVCECDGRCGHEHHGVRCCAPNGVEIYRNKTISSQWRRPESGMSEHAWRGPLKVVLAVAHLDHTPEHCRGGNLMAMCQLCHNAYDAEHRKETRKRTGRLRLEEDGQKSLF